MRKEICPGMPGRSREAVAFLLAGMLSLSACAEEDARTFTIEKRGGQFSAWGVTLTVPPGAVSAPLSVTVTRQASTVTGVVFGTAHLLAPVAATFRKPVVLTLWLAPENLTKGSTAGDLSMVQLTGSGWQALASLYDVDAALQLSASVLTLGTFAVWDARAGKVPDGGVDGLAPDAGKAEGGPDGPTALDGGAGDGGGGDLNNDLPGGDGPPDLGSQPDQVLQLDQPAQLDQLVQLDQPGPPPPDLTPDQ